MAAPATTERTRAAVGAIPANFKEPAPDELKVEGVEAAAEVPTVTAVTAGVDAVDEGDVKVTDGVDEVGVELKRHLTTYFTCHKQ